MISESPEVVREHGRRAPQRIATREALHYRRWLTDGAHKSGRVDPIEFQDVANECRHERLPGDPCPSPDGVWPHPHACDCWGERARTPDLLSITKKEKPTMAVAVAAAPSPTTPDPEAPWGRRADGSPRKRPGRAPAVGKKPEPAKAKPALAVVPDAPAIAPAIQGAINHIDARIAKLQRAREALLDVAA